jgi:hypothetical protein
MANSKNVYKAPPSGQPLITTISSGCKTPILEIKFCNLLRPFYYPNSPTIPRYSITCVIDPEEHKEFLKGIQTIEQNEKVDSIVKADTHKQDGQHLTTGKFTIKFQTKEIVPVYSTSSSDPKAPVHGSMMELEDELQKGERVYVGYDILRYTKKNSLFNEHALSFKPVYVCYISSESKET